MLQYVTRADEQGPLDHTPTLGPSVWIHSLKPTDEELDALTAGLSLDRDLLRDALDFYEVPRFEADDGAIYLFTRFPYETNAEITTAPILLVLTSDVLVTITIEEVPFLERFTSGKARFTTAQPKRLFLELVGASNSSYRTHLITIRRDVQKSRVNLRDIRNHDIERLVGLESTLNDLLSALLPTQTALRTMQSGSFQPFTEDDHDKIEDVQLENQQIIESAKSNLKTIQNIRGSYTAIVTNNLNQVIKLLTALTIILMIPTIISSLYGMNVMLPLGELPYAFWIIVVLTLVAMAAIARVFRRRDWL